MTAEYFASVVQQLKEHKPENLLENKKTSAKTKNIKIYIEIPNLTKLVKQKSKELIFKNLYSFET